jgi:antitoxin VapB
MSTAKLFKHGGSQAVRLPKAFRFEGAEVIIEKRGEEVILKPKRRPKFKSLNEAARYFAKKHPQGAEFPDILRPKEHERPIIDLSLP